MKLVGAVSVALAAFAPGSFADAVCCSPLKIIHATLTPSGDLQRRLDEVATCTSRRAANIEPFTDTAGDFWQLTGEDLEEDEFTRFVYDMSNQNSYWTMTGGGGDVPEAQKVVAFTLTDDATFRTGWDSTALNPLEECSDSQFTGLDLFSSIMDRSKWLVLLPQPSVEPSWTAWVESGGYSSIASSFCGTGCNTVVGERTAGDLLTDVHAALITALSLDSCEPCDGTTTTSTTSEPTSTTDQSTTLLSTTPLSTTPQPTQPPTTDATTSGGRATVAMATMLPSLIVSVVGIAAVLF